MVVIVNVEIVFLGVVAVQVFIGCLAFATGSKIAFAFGEFLPIIWAANGNILFALFVNAILA